MRLDTLKYFYEHSVHQNPSFYYRGPFLDKFTSVLVDMSRSSTKNETAEGAISKKTSFILVECFQNILKHSEVVDDPERTKPIEGMFSFKYMHGAFVVNSINVISNSDTFKLESSVNTVNSLDKAALKDYYLESLKNNELSDKGGAGLGLIEMARKSGEKIRYKMEAIDENLSLFHQQLTVKNHELNEADFDAQLQESGVFYERMKVDNLILMYKGDFSQKSILPLLELAEHNVHDKSIDSRRTIRAAHVTVEILQNISKHSGKSSTGESRFGIFMLGRENETLSILAGNIVNEQEKVLLQEKLDYLISLDSEELKELHKNTLVATLRFQNKTNSGLGLIEVAQASKNSMNYRFYPYGENQFLFVLHVNI